MAPVLILCLSNLWPPFPGGAERLAFNLARNLYRRGHAMHVITGYEHALPLDGPPLTIQPIGTGATRDEGAEMVAKAIADIGPDLILTHHLYAFEFEAELVATGIPLVQVVLNGHRIPEARLAVYISEWVRQQTGGAQPQDLVLTPPVFPEVVSDSHGDAIGFIKPLPHKGAELVYVVAEAMPERRFVILRGEWQDLEVIRPLPNVRFMEPVVDIREFYAECRMVLVPSRSEDAGTVGQEATLNGLPCLSTSVGGLAETNGGGVLLPPDDVGAWVRAICLLDDPEAYCSVVNRQRAHLEAADHAATLDLLAERVSSLMEAVAR